MQIIRNIVVGIFALWLTGCSLTTIAPIEQLQKSLTQEKSLSPTAKSGRNTVKQQPITKFYCDKKKVVQIQPSSSKKNSAVKIVFNHLSFELSPTVSDKGKKYSNIRWIWLEDFNGNGTLIDNRHRVLASNCVKQKATQRSAKKAKQNSPKTTKKK